MWEEEKESGERGKKKRRKEGARFALPACTSVPIGRQYISFRIDISCVGMMGRIDDMEKWSK